VWFNTTLFQRYCLPQHTFSVVLFTTTHLFSGIVYYNTPFHQCGLIKHFFSSVVFCNVRFNSVVYYKTLFQQCGLTQHTFSTVWFTTHLFGTSILKKKTFFSSVVYCKTHFQQCGYNNTFLAVLFKQELSHINHYFLNFEK